MKLFKKPRSPYWYYRFTINGKEIRGSTKRPHNDRQGAQRFMHQEYERKLNAAQFGEKPDITLADAMDRVNKTVEGETLRSYDLSRRKWIGEGVFNENWHLKPDTLLRNLTQSDLEDHLIERKAEGLTGNSINIEVRYIRRVVNYNRRSFMAPSDLEFEQVKTKGKIRYLTDAEEVEVLNLLTEQAGSPAYDKARDFFIFAIDTGLRVNDALGVQWFDIDLTERRIEAYQDKVDEECFVPISDRVYHMLKARHNQKAPFMEMSRAIRLLRAAIHKVCNSDERLVKRKGKATIHSLRDTFATRLDRKGMTLKKISRLLGHASTKMTEKYTQTESIEAADEARSLINQ